MSASVPVWVSATTLLVAAATAAWNIIRDRSSLGKLERVTSITAHLAPGSRAHSMMRDVRDRLAVQVALASEAPTHPRRFLIGWALLILGFAGAVGWFSFAIAVAGPLSWRYPVVWVPYIIGLAIASIGQGVLVFRGLAISTWKNTRFLEYPDDTDFLRALSKGAIRLPDPQG